MSKHSLGNLTYEPERGDLVYLDFDPQAGHEQAGRRPAIVLSPKAYNSVTGLCVVCPVTNQAKGYPFEVPLGQGRITGVVLSDHVKSLDWVARNIQYVGKAGSNETLQVLAKSKSLLS